MERLLLHICCAPCSVFCVDSLRAEGIEPAAFWFNPNIHPYTEYQARKHTLEEYAKEIGMKLVIGGTYDLRPFITAVAGDIDGRCAYCYRVRMERTAQYAAENGYDSFTTSLLISPYQNHEGIAAAAREMGVEMPVGNVLSSDTFYDASGSTMKWGEMGVLAVEMESAALYTNAAAGGANALCILTISDGPDEITTAEERQTAFTQMMEVALALA